MKSLNGMKCRVSAIESLSTLLMPGSVDGENGVEVLMVSVMQMELEPDRSMMPRSVAKRTELSSCVTESPVPRTTSRVIICAGMKVPSDFTSNDQTPSEVNA